MRLDILTIDPAPDFNVLRAKKKGSEKLKLSCIFLFLAANLLIGTLIASTVKISLSTRTYMNQSDTIAFCE